MACDHTDDAQVEAVFDRIADEQGRLDLVVNVASPDFSEMVGVVVLGAPVRDMTRCLDDRPAFGLRHHRARGAADDPAGLGRRRSTSRRTARIDYLLSVPYGVGKAASTSHADTASNCSPHGVAVVSLWPGLVLTEGLLANTTVAEDGTRQLHGLDISFGESAEVQRQGRGRARCGPEHHERTGGSFWLEPTRA